MRRHATLLDFGTPFDHGSGKSALAYYEAKIAAGETLSDDELRACRNRQLLYRVMTPSSLFAVTSGLLNKNFSDVIVQTRNGFFGRDFTDR